MPSPSNYISGRSAFSLVEVVVALGIFAVSIVAVVGLMGALARSVSEVEDADATNRVVSNLESQLKQVGFNAIRNYMGSVINKSEAERIYASRDGAKLGRGDATNIWNPPGNPVTDQNGNGTNADEINAQKYFLVEILPDDTLSPSDNDTTAGFLAFTVRLIYPAYNGAGVRIEDSAQQSVSIVSVAITR